MRKKKYCHFCKTLLIKKNTEGRKRLFCPTCIEPLYENPIPATCSVLIDDNEQILLVKRNIEPKIGMWCLPGGFMELDESPEEAALRELKEETGLDGQIEQLLGVTTNKSAQYTTVLMMGFLIKKYSGKLIAGDDASEVKFFNYKDLPEIAFESHRSYIRIYYYSLQTETFP